MNGIAAEYTRFAVMTDYDGLPGEVVVEAKKRILDLIGVALCGYGFAFPQIAVNYIVETGGKPEATVIRAKGKFPACNAAFANAACAHALDLDDGHRYACMHPGAPIIPSALAACEMCGASTKALIAGVTIGYEIAIRIGKSINPSHLKRGFHTTGTVGIFGAAAAAGKIIGLNAEEMANALGIAGHQGAGLMEFSYGGGMVKPINPAKAAMGGLLSAILAKRGVKGSTTIFEGKNGFIKAMSDGQQADSFTKDLGKVFEIGKTQTKLHACCRHIHTPIDIALKICSQNGISAGGISNILVETYPVAIQTCIQITHPEDVSTAKFCIPFSIALALCKGDANADKYTVENIRDKEIYQLADKVEISTSKKWEELYPGKRGATVGILTSDGKVYSDTLELAKGEPENPLTTEELFNKFHSGATQLLSDKEALLLRESIMNLENLSIEDIASLLAGK